MPYASLAAASPQRSSSRAPWLWAGAAVAVVVVLIAAVGLGGRSAPTSTASTGSPTFTAVPASPAPAAVPSTLPAVAAPNPGPPKTITAREWAKIAKDPDRHVGETVVVYGQVSQFDSATGDDTFRANVDGVVHRPSYGFADYEINTVLTTQGADLGDLVQKDLFRAEVVVAGSLSYDTTLGGSMTVPHLLVTKIAVMGSAK